MRTPVKTYFHPRGPNVYGIKPPKFNWMAELAAWGFVAGLIWVLWKLA